MQYDLKRHRVDFSSIPSNEFSDIYGNEANIISQKNTVAQKRAKQEELVKLSTKDKVARFIMKYGHNVNFGTYKMIKNVKIGGQLHNTAGIWKMEIDADGNSILVKNYKSQSGKIRKNDSLVASKDFTDVYGDSIVKGSYLNVVDAYDDIAEVLVGQTGIIHICRAYNVAESCQERAMDKRAEQRTASIVVPNKFKDMIKAYTQKNDDQLDMRLWMQFRNQAGNQLNDYDLMRSYVDGLFQQRSASQRTAVDKATVDYYKEMWGDVAPEYAKELTSIVKVKEKKASIRSDYKLMMQNCPSRNALIHHKNTIAKLAKKYGEEVSEIMDVVNDDEPQAPEEQVFDDGNVVMY